MTGSSIRLNAWLAAVTIGLVVGAIGCGSSDSGSAHVDVNTSQAKGGGNQPASPAEVKAVKAVMPDLRREWNTSDGQGFCDRLTPAGRREILRFAASLEGQLKSKTCGGIITEYSGRVLKAGARHLPVRTKKIEVNGNRAMVDIMGGLAGTKSVTFKLTKEDGTWKLTNPLTAASSRSTASN
jgi:hypothetical protein